MFIDFVKKCVILKKICKNKVNQDGVEVYEQRKKKNIGNTEVFQGKVRKEVSGFSGSTGRGSLSYAAAPVL